jgi:hypothetical protein
LPLLPDSDPGRGPGLADDASSLLFLKADMLEAA